MMHFLSIFFCYVILLQIDAFAQLSSSSCTLLRTADSLATIIPEVAQLAMRFHRASSFSSQHHRQKRFLFNANKLKDANSASSLKGTIVEQMITNSIQNMNFTYIAISILNNNETMNKIRENIDNEAIIRIVLQEIDYEKLGSGLWSAADNNFDLEHFIDNIINMTHMNIIHGELIVNGTLPEEFLQNIHPDLDGRKIQQIFSTLKHTINRFVQVLSTSERFDNYLFNMVTKQALTPLNNIIQRVQKSKPETFNQLIEIIINSANKAAMETMTTSKQPTSMATSDKKSLPPVVTIVDLNDSDDVKLMLYQWSIAIDSMGQTVRIILKSLEKLYCTSSWE
ncbi:unnamed protein product [Rotaria socialis]|uniref:Uncharacterized protein n=1 Tax=Rotaria socialis TaxID=392032 RepID=A0A817TB71_9BILA|nr:unnamed protein product [Rotaria socialis]CAF4099746.1 unnamed protein product [Rotaria socialis]